MKRRFRLGLPYWQPSNKLEWNNCFIKFQLNSKSLEVRNTFEKREKIRGKSKKLDVDAMLCNTWWSDRRSRLITKTFLTFSRTSKRRKFPQKRFFFCVIWEKFRFPAQKMLVYQLLEESFTM